MIHDGKQEECLKQTMPNNKMLCSIVEKLCVCNLISNYRVLILRLTLKN